MTIWFSRIFTPHNRLFLGWRMVFAGIFFGQSLIVLPIEIAAIPRCIHIGQLQQSFTAHHPLGNRVLAATSGSV